MADHDMIDRSMSAELDALDQASSSNKVSAYESCLDSILNSPDRSHLLSVLSQYVTKTLSDSVGIANSRLILNTLAQRIRSISATETRIKVAENTIQQLQPKVVSFEEQDTQLKEVLADTYEELQDYLASAKALQSITLSSSQRDISNVDKAKVWIRITRCYLEEDDSTNAVTFLNRVKNTVHVNDLESDEIRLQFQLCQARISDSQRQFLDASASYHSLSTQSQIDEGERLQALSAAIVCAVLAPAGPKRVRQLARLYEDSRAVAVDEYSILEKIYLDRILTPSQVSAFSDKLRPHQKAATADGSTVLEKAVLEHNLLAASRLYSNISTSVLGSMLGVDGQRAEIYAAQMIEQGRLRASIDQIDEVIYFGEKVRTARQTARDENVKALTDEVERVADLIKVARPELYAQHMVQ